MIKFIKDQSAILYKIVFILSLLGLLCIVIDFGFTKTNLSQNILNFIFYFILISGIFTTLLRYLLKLNNFVFRWKVFIFDLITIVFTLTLLYFQFIYPTLDKNSHIFENDLWMRLAIIFTFIREFSEIRVNYKRTVLNPAQLFIISFLFIILMGSFLLLLPNATTNGISFIDALFTSTSAVCVTGLAVVDTSSAFTLFGQTIILVLIQIGGLGILTFASYFSYFFKGGTTYENQLVLGDITSSRKLGEVFSTLKYILFITFGIEIFSGILIYLSLDAQHFNSQFDQIFFSMFHSVSAFCNAGFSTLSSSLYDAGFRYNYFLQLVIIFTFVMGGLGFPIVVNILKYIKYKFVQLLNFSSRTKNYKPWVLNLNSRITLVTTISISFVAFVFFYFLEYNNTLAEHNDFGKIVTSLFGATTPRTAGFNTIDTSALNFSTIIMVFLLMWMELHLSQLEGVLKQVLLPLPL